MDIRRIKHGLADLKLAVVGYKTGNEPEWLRIKHLASLQARVEESDELACGAIAGEVRRHPKAANEARERLAPYMSCYEADRAVRLIDAAKEGLPVRSIRSGYVDLFAQEARLGRMSLREAFAEMVAREPELERIRQRYEESHAALMVSTDERTERSSRYASFVVQRDAQREVAQIIGPQSRHPDPLLRSYLPCNMAYSWLRTISGDPPRVDPDVSYFSASDSLSMADEGRS